MLKIWLNWQTKRLTGVFSNFPGICSNFVYTPAFYRRKIVHVVTDVNV